MRNNDVIFDAEVNELNFWLLNFFSSFIFPFRFLKTGKHSLY